jgi:hypothetical protein
MTLTDIYCLYNQVRRRQGRTAIVPHPPSFIWRIHIGTENNSLK